MSTPFYPLLQLAQSLRIKFTSQELWIRIIFERKDSVSTVGSTNSSFEVVDCDRRNEGVEFWILVP